LRGAAALEKIASVPNWEKNKLWIELLSNSKQQEATICSLIETRVLKHSTKWEK
jgi:hypothetical protein